MRVHVYVYVRAHGTTDVLLGRVARYDYVEPWVLTSRSANG